MPQINNLQKSLIHIGIAELGIDDETYRLMLKRYGVDTCKDLQYSEASALIDDLKKKGFRIKRKRIRPSYAKPSAGKKPSNVVYLPTRQQLSLIDHLRQDVIWRVEGGFFLWMKKFLGRTYVKNEKEAQKVIEALKGIKKHQMGRWGDREMGSNGEM